MKSNKLTFTAATIAAMLAAAQSLAVPQGAFWVEIPVVDHPDDATDLSGFRTFRLYVQLEEGDTVTAADFGVAGPNSGLSTTQAIFNHPAGGDLIKSDLLIDFFPDLFYDTYLALGDLDGAASPSPISVQNFNTSNPSSIVGVWSPNAVSDFMAFPDSQNVIWLAQITVSSAYEYGEGGGPGEFTGGQLFLSGDGPNGEFGMQVAATGVVDIPGTFPLGQGRLPGAFQMLAPACGDVNVPVHNVVLEWENHPDAVLYNVIVTTDFRFLSGGYVVDVQGSTSHLIPAGILDPCTTYYWSVRADDFIISTRLATNWEFCSFTTSVLGDINADGAVDTADLSQLITDYQTASPTSDLNGDGVVDTADLGQLIAGFGQTCD